MVISLILITKLDYSVTGVNFIDIKCFKSITIITIIKQSL